MGPTGQNWENGGRSGNNGNARKIRGNWEKWRKPEIWEKQKKKYPLR